MHVHRALLDEYMVAPHLVEQLRAAVHALGMLHQEMQQLELGGPHLQGLALEGDPVGRGVQHQLANAHAVAHLLRCAAAQHRTDAGQQLLRGKGLGDVVVGTGVQPGHLVRLIPTRGEHEDGDGLGAAVGTPLARQRQTTLPRQHPVEQDHVGQHGIELALRAVAVFRPKGLETVVAQVDRNQLGNRGFVLHDEDTGKLSHGESAPRTYSTADSISSRAVWRTSLPLTR